MINKYKQYVNENTYIDEFIRLYNLAPKSLQQEVDNTKGVKQSPEWHPEGDVYIHSRLVTNRLFNCYHDINLSLSGFFHDLGKTIVTVANDHGGFSAHGHEDESVKTVLEYSDWIKEQGGKVDIVEYVVANHMRIKYMEEMRLQEVIKFMNEPYFSYVEKFSTADIGGTDLECNKIPEYTEIKQKISDFELKEKQNKIISKRFNAGMIMDKYPELRGEKLGKALGEFKNRYDDFRNFVLNNPTEKILNDFDEFMSTINESLRDKMTPKSEEDIKKALMEVRPNDLLEFLHDNEEFQPFLTGKVKEKLMKQDPFDVITNIAYYNLENLFTKKELIEILNRLDPTEKLWQMDKFDFNEEELKELED